MKTTWIRGPREIVTNRDNKGKVTVMKGKHGGPIVKQAVMKVLSPRKGS